MSVDNRIHLSRDTKPPDRGGNVVALPAYGQKPLLLLAIAMSALLLPREWRRRERPRRSAPLGVRPSRPLFCSWCVGKRRHGDR